VVGICQVESDGKEEVKVVDTMCSTYLLKTHVIDHTTIAEE